MPVGKPVIIGLPFMHKVAPLLPEAIYLHGDRLPIPRIHTAQNHELEVRTTGPECLGGLQQFRITLAGLNDPGAQQERLAVPTP
jgi:hypothetical protein